MRDAMPSVNEDNGAYEFLGTVLPGPRRAAPHVVDAPRARPALPSGMQLPTAGPLTAVGAYRREQIERKHRYPVLF